MEDLKIIIGDNRKLLPELLDKTIQCCITSPPYWGLRDYEHDAQIGSEPSPVEYVQNLVKVFREVKRVLHDDGTLWLNIGDGYARNGGVGKPGPNAMVGNTKKEFKRETAKCPIAGALKTATC